MWTGIALTSLLLSGLLVYLLFRVYRESDDDFHPESHAHRGSV